MPVPGIYSPGRAFFILAVVFAGVHKLGGAYGVQTATFSYQRRNAENTQMALDAKSGTEWESTTPRLSRGVYDA